MKSAVKLQANSVPPVHKAGANLLKFARERDMTLQGLSRLLKKNDTYLQQFVTRGVPRELPMELRLRLSAILGCPLDDITVDKGLNGLIPGHKPGTLKSRPSKFTSNGQLPMLGVVRGGEIDFSVPGKSKSMVVPTVLLGVEGAYGTEMPDKTMEPAIRKGAQVYVHPTQQAKPGDDIVLRLKTGRGVIRTLILRGEDFLIVQQYNPSQKHIVPTADIEAVHLIVASSRVVP